MAAAMATAMVMACSKVAMVVTAAAAVTLATVPLPPALSLPQFVHGGGSGRFV